MCGIIGYVGRKTASPILLEGLRRLEYRGYDSAGLAVLDEDALAVRKKKGRIDAGLGRLLQTSPLAGHLGIGHTRWATHGVPADENSHPHLDASGKIAVVHNGVIENYDALKQRLVRAGHKFQSTTDTEVLAHLIGEHYEKLAPRRPARRPAPADPSNGESGSPATGNDLLTQAVWRQCVKAMFKGHDVADGALVKTGAVGVMVMVSVFESFGKMPLVAERITSVAPPAVGVPATVTV